jgi:hypothetical protein
MFARVICCVGVVVTGLDNSERPSRPQPRPATVCAHASTRYLLLALGIPAL